MARATTMTVRPSGPPSDFAAANAGETGIVTVLHERMHPAARFQEHREP